MAEDLPTTPEARAERFAAMRWLHEMTSTIAERHVQMALPEEGAAWLG